MFFYSTANAKDIFGDADDISSDSAGEDGDKEKEAEHDMETVCFIIDLYCQCPANVVKNDTDENHDIIALMALEYI